MLNPVLNLPLLIGHHKHPFTKPRIVGNQGLWGLRGWTKQHKALPNGRHWIKPKPASMCPRREKTEKPRIMLFLSSAASTRHKHKRKNNHQTKTELKREREGKKKMGRNEPSCLSLAWISGSCPLRARVCRVQLETGAQSPLQSLKTVSRMASICCFLINAVSNGGNVPKYGAGEVSS